MIEIVHIRIWKFFVWGVFAYHGYFKRHKDEDSQKLKLLKGTSTDI